MTNAYYTPGGVPGQGTFGASVSLRTEFGLLQTAFDKLPTLTATKFVAVDAAGATLTSATPITFSGNDVTFAGLLVAPTAPSISTHVINKAFADSTYLPLGGGQAMTGALNMGAFKITAMGTPTVGTDAATKAYVDGQAFTGALPGQSGATTGQFVRSNGSVAAWGNPIGVTTSKTANYTAVAGDQFVHDTSGGGFTLTLPAGSAGAAPILVHDLKGTFATNNLTIATTGGDLIMGLASPALADVNNFSASLVFTGASQGWRFL